MRPFRFRLERLRNWQEKVCRTEEEKLRLCLARVAEAREELMSLERQCASSEKDFQAQTRIGPSDLKALAEFRRAARNELMGLEREEKARQSAVAQQQQQLLTERRKLEVLEKLRRRALTEYQAEADRELEALGLESHLAAKGGGKL